MDVSEKTMLIGRLRPSVFAVARRGTRSASTAQRREMYERMIRVDHAGEFGADRIYAGQMAVLGNTDAGRVVRDMWEQEKEHLRLFNNLIDKHNVRPTALMPFWNIAGTHRSQFIFYRRQQQQQQP